ncbi:MAG: metallophosphoesterase [Candidatus Saganbacteria bacterium]|nr:metallophosphoesterase [Candidatus Saganbacteria bacterium]
MIKLSRPAVAAVLVQLFLILFSIRAFAFSFAVMGDNQGNDKIFQKILTMVDSDKSINFAVNTGDITSTSSAWEFKKYKSMISHSRVKFYNCIGNHDVQYLGRQIFMATFGSTYYSWDHGGYHFICLDNVRPNGLGSLQYSWLKKDLSLNKDKPKFIFMHKPLFDISGSFPEEVMFPRAQAASLTAIFKKNKVKAVFCGHVHGYAKEEKDGVLYIIAAGGGGSLYLPYFSGGFYNYVNITVDDDNIYDEVIKIEDEN